MCRTWSHLALYTVSKQCVEHEVVPGTDWSQLTRLNELSRCSSCIQSTQRVVRIAWYMLFKQFTQFKQLSGEIAECTRQLVLARWYTQHRVVFIIVRLFNTFDIIDICVLCVWHDSIKEIYYYYYYYYYLIISTMLLFMH